MLKYTKITILVLLMTLTNELSAFQTNAYKTETVNGIVFVLHEVVAKETIFSIARKYNVRPKDITENNPEAKRGLAIGQIVRVPLQRENEVERTAGILHIVKEQETLYSLSKKYNVGIEDIKKWNKLEGNELDIGQKLTIEKRMPPVNQVVIGPVDYSGEITHQVATGETLYSISQQYDKSIEQLKAWNELADNTLSIGQVLIVGEKKNGQVIDKPDEVGTIDTDSEKQVIRVDTTRFTGDQAATRVYSTEKSPEQIKYDSTYFETKTVKNANGFEETVQNGLAEVIEGSKETRKYLALHRTAKIGTIMKVRNEMNNKMVFVRVLGRIPATGDNDKVLIKLSNAAYKRLGAIDKRFRVELTYMP